MKKQRKKLLFLTFLKEICAM